MQEEIQAKEEIKVKFVSHISHLIVSSHRRSKPNTLYQIMKCCEHNLLHFSLTSSFTERRMLSGIWQYNKPTLLSLSQIMRISNKKEKWFLQLFSFYIICTWMIVVKVSFQINVLFAQFKDKVFLMKKEKGKDLKIKNFSSLKKW